MNLAPDAQALFERAKAEARKRGHDALRPEHVLHASLAVPAAVVILARRGVDLRRLRELLDARLGALPAVTGYRDAAHETPLSAALDALVDQGAGKRVLFFLRVPLGVADVVVRLVAAAPCADIIEEARFDTAPIERLSAAARRHATERNHRNVLVDHALLALFDEDAAFVEALRVLGHDPAAVRRKIDARLTKRLRSHLLAAVESLVQLVSLRTAIVEDAAAIAPIVVDLLRHPSARAAIEAADVNRYDLLFAYVHAKAPAVPKLDRTKGEVDVVFFDDPYSTMEFVLRVLKDALHLSEAEAKKKMLEVHEVGESVVATLPRDRAAAAAVHARGAARDALMPLRIELVDR